MHATPSFPPEQQSQGSRSARLHSRPIFSSYTPTTDTSIQSYAQCSSVHTPSDFIRPSLSGPSARPVSPTSSISLAHSWGHSPRVHHISPPPPLGEVGSEPQHFDHGGSACHPWDQGQSHTQSEGEDRVPATTDFVRKLYHLLEDDAFSDVVCWGPQGDFFIIKDVNTFTTNILPYTFKHSNFASFVRQLNKYDFHKIRTKDNDQFGSNSWSFRHTHFYAGGLDALENIKRKVPGSKKPSQSTSPPISPAVPNTMDNLQAQIESLVQQQDTMTAQISNIENEYVGVLDGMVNLQRDLAHQDGAIWQLVQYLVQHENGGTAS